MTTAYLTSSAVSGVNIDLSAGEDLFIGPSATRVSTDNVAILADEGGHAIDVLGDVYGEDAGVRIGVTGQSLSSSRLTVAEGASVTGRVYALEVLSSDVTLSNAGFMSANDGIRVDTGNFYLSNTGTITGTFGSALDIEATFGAVINSGTILADRGSTAIRLSDTSPGFGDLPEIINSGLILSSELAIFAATDNDLLVRNSGEIHGRILANSGDDFIVNTGLIEGNVDLGGGNDTYDGRGGRITGTVSGGGGDDTYILDDPTVGIVDLGTGTDTVRINADYELQNTLENLDLVGGGDLRGEGNYQNNRMTAGMGDDTLSGGQGDDTLVGRFGADRLDGGEGTDRVEYLDSQGWVNVSLLTGFVGGGAGSHAVGDSFVSIEDVWGSQYGDRLNGDHGANMLFGANGDDILRGRGGADTLDGGSGSDTADYEDSAAWVNVSLLTGFVGGGAGSHAVGDSFVSVENLTGSQYADRLNGDGNNNILQGRLGGDTIDGNGGSDTADYSGSAGFVNVSLLTGFAGGGSGSHALGDVLSDIENLTGSRFDDILNGDNFANVLEGGRGDDLLRGNNGADTFVFSDGFGTDTVTDFSDTAEFFDMTAHSGVTAFADLTVTANGADAVIADPFGNTITVTGAAGLIDAADFFF